MYLNWIYIYMYIYIDVYICNGIETHQDTAKGGHVTWWRGDVTRIIKSLVNWNLKRSRLISPPLQHYMVSDVNTTNEHGISRTTASAAAEFGRECCIKLEFVVWIVYAVRWGDRTGNESRKGAMLRLSPCRWTSGTKGGTNAKIGQQTTWENKAIDGSATKILHEQV